MTDEIKERLQAYISDLSGQSRINAINEIKLFLHSLSPFSGEPVDCVLWIPSEMVVANDYNPNRVAPPEMKLLETSIRQDGYTQPIVTWTNGDNTYEVIDGFHRNRVGKECIDIRSRLGGYLPVTCVKADSTERGNRIAATIRHNRARGRHTVEGMSDIILELKNRNWTNERIAKNLGMDEDEILRLCQITGLAALFEDQEFSKAWDIEDSVPAFSDLTEEDGEPEDDDKFRTVNTSDENRVFHKFEMWECYKAGFYATTKDGMTKDECEAAYAEFLADTTRFRAALDKVITEWKYSCEHYLTNTSMNRIAWLGQAAMCYATGVPAVFRGGYNLLTKAQQDEANTVALEYLNKWQEMTGRDQASMDEAISDKQMNLY